MPIKFSILLSILMLSTPTLAQELKKDPNVKRMAPGFALLGTMGLFPVENTTLSLGGWVAPKEDPTEVDQSRFTLQHPVYRDEKDSFAVSVGGNSLHFSHPQQLNGNSLENRFWRLEGGGSFLHKIDDSRMWGSRFSLGSASDAPFSQFSVTTISASAFYSWSASEESRWVISIFTSNNSPLINYVPIPGFFYFYQNEKIVGMFGFPFNALLWMPTRGWSILVSSFFPTINTEIAWGSPFFLQIYSGFALTQQSFLRKDRIQSNDRLFYSSAQVPVGMRLALSRSIRTDFSVGYAFNRSLHEGTGSFRAERGRQSIGSSWYGSLNLNFVF